MLQKKFVDWIFMEWCTHIFFVTMWCKQHIWDLRAQKLRFHCFGSRTNSEPVQWFIGDVDFDKIEESQLFKKGRRTQVINREGVEFYSNDDFYEGEFHKGRCNGSGVYNYFVNGRYEGDWIDGKYDGYGIESWARGSKYRGQYRQGLMHVYGVYKFYTGDSYAGEWCNGQSHGVGVQSCGDGSCYIGEFKCGVKHGIGCYHFRYTQTANPRNVPQLIRTIVDKPGLLHVTLKNDDQVVVNNVIDIPSTAATVTGTSTFSPATPLPKLAISKRPIVETPGPDKRMKQS